MARKTATLDTLDIADVKTLGPVSNGDEPSPSDSEYAIEVSIQGITPMLMHRYDTQAVKDKGAAKKGSKDKKTDNLDSYVYKDDDGYLAVPGEALWACLGEAARRMQDPSSCGRLK